MTNGVLLLRSTYIKGASDPDLEAFDGVVLEPCDEERKNA